MIYQTNKSGNFCFCLKRFISSREIDPLENYKNIGFLNNTGPDPLKNHKATKPALNVGPSAAHQRNAVFGVSLAGRWWPAFSAILDPLTSLKRKEKEKEKKTLSELDSPWKNFLDPCMTVDTN